MAHLTVEQRYTISRMLKLGHSQSSIARTIDKDKSVVSREIRRNSDGRSGEYCSDLAPRKAMMRHQKKSKCSKMVN
ncbi:MAG: helix-turn-helix domain-containing protein [Flavobacteriaceae bacterium]|nr:helix-turn-helix domain-containing protein [Flavobacteriaceae bacterium]